MTHEFKLSYSGQGGCAQLVTDIHGFGVECGQESDSPKHDDWLETAITLAIGYEPTMVSLAPGVGGLAHRTVQDRDELVDRISKRLRPLIQQHAAFTIHGIADEWAPKQGMMWMSMAARTLNDKANEIILKSEEEAKTDGSDDGR